MVHFILQLTDLYLPIQFFRGNKMSNRRAIITSALLFLFSQALIAQPGNMGTLPDVPEFGSAAFPSLPVDLLPPGARALGLAGAFSAVADDATAAEANPAGLTILSESEVSIHIRNSDYSIPFVDPEALDSVSGDSFGGQLLKTFEDSSTDVSFASFVKPFDNWVFSAFYQNTLSINASTAETSFDTFFVDEFINENALSADVESFGLSGAFRINDKLSLGITIKNADLDLRSFEQEQVLDFLDIENIFATESGLGTPEQFAAVIDERSIASTSLDGNDSDITFNIGLLLNPNDNFSVGLVYKEGGSFDIAGSINQQRILQCTGSGELSEFCDAVLALLDPQVLADFNENRTFNNIQEINIPDRLTLGFAWRPSDTWLLSLDIDRIGYSDLPTPRANSLAFRVPVEVEEIDDEFSFHVGIEKVFPLSGQFMGMNILTLRTGAFTDQDHDGYAILDTDDTHFTVGLGAIFGQNLQVDLAAEFSDSVDNIVASAIYRF